MYVSYPFPPSPSSLSQTHPTPTVSLSYFHISYFCSSKPRESYQCCPYRRRYRAILWSTDNPQEATFLKKTLFSVSSGHQLPRTLSQCWGLLSPSLPRWNVVWLNLCGRVQAAMATASIWAQWPRHTRKTLGHTSASLPWPLAFIAFQPSLPPCSLGRGLV